MLTCIVPCPHRTEKPSPAPPILCGVFRVPVLPVGPQRVVGSRPAFDGGRVADIGKGAVPLRLWWLVPPCGFNSLPGRVCADVAQEEECPARNRRMWLQVPPSACGRVAEWQRTGPQNPEMGVRLPPRPLAGEALTAMHGPCKSESGAHVPVPACSIPVHVAQGVERRHGKPRRRVRTPPWTLCHRSQVRYGGGPENRWGPRPLEGSNPSGGAISPTRRYAYVPTRLWMGQ